MDQQPQPSQQPVNTNNDDNENSNNQKIKEESQHESSNVNYLEEPEQFIFEEIFSLQDIQEINDSTAPKVVACNMLEKYYTKKFGKVDLQSNLLMAQAEFHVNNLNFLQEQYKDFSPEIICKLLNLLGILLNLEESEYNINLPKNTFNEEDEIKRYAQVPEPDFGYVCNKKLAQLKQGLKFLKFIPAKKEEINYPPTYVTETEMNFYLNQEEVKALLDYLKIFYFPFIRLYYHFINIDRITENKKLEVIVNRPLPVPPLSEAVRQKLEKNIIDEPKGEADKEEDEDEENEEEEKEEEEKDNEQNKAYLDIMNRVNLNNEAKKIVTERIEEVHKDFDAKISERQRGIENRVKEAQELVKPKKK